MYDSSRDSSSAHLKRTLYHFHFCCGLGGGARGFNRARPVVGNVEAQWECLGGVDVYPAGLRDFERLAGVPGTLLDLFTREQYTRFHGQQPPAGWTEATAEDIRRAAQNLRPDAVFISSPCKGASGLLSEATSKTPKYQALNELTLRCIWLMGEAWKDEALNERHALRQFCRPIQPSAVLSQPSQRHSQATRLCLENGGAVDPVGQAFNARIRRAPLSTMRPTTVPITKSG